MRRRVRLAAVVAAGLAAVALPPWIAAQQTIRVDTNLVRIDVYPTIDGVIVDGLTVDDFEVLEDGAPQRVTSFEHIVPTKGPQTARADPNNTRDMLAAVADGRNRLFLIFLDGTHVDFKNAVLVNEPLMRFLRQEVADDDLVGVMTPEMSASNITFMRRTEAIERQLKDNFDWGRRGRQLPEIDSRDIQYEMCYPPVQYPGLAAKMMARRRERMTLEALQDAVRFLHTIREERKAIVTVTQGWQIYGPDPTMLNVKDPALMDKVRVGPTGQLTTQDPKNTVNVSRTQCDADRNILAAIDDDRLLKDLIDDANRGNASFYMIDPGGLQVTPPDRSNALRTLAENTDGLALLNSNDLNGAWKRVADDQSSYYLLGYSSTNPKPDGRFREITVKVKRPGVQVRARRGYRAPTREEIANARTVAATAAPAASPESAAADRALASLSRIRADLRFRINAAVARTDAAGIWVAGELTPLPGPPDEFMRGASVTLDATGAGVSANTRVELKPGERTFVVRLDAALPAEGTIDLRARATSADGVAAPLTDSLRIDLGERAKQPLLFRRGLSTGNRLLPAADLRFSRTERVRLEVPVGAEEKPGQGRLLDRAGQPLQVPVTVAERTDAATGQRWITADVTLAPLSAGDYIVEFSLEGAAEPRVTAAIRVTR